MEQIKVGQVLWRIKIKVRIIQNFKPVGYLSLSQQNFNEQILMHGKELLSIPPGGDQDALASLRGSTHIVHLNILYSL